MKLFKMLIPNTLTLTSLFFGFSSILASIEVLSSFYSLKINSDRDLLFSSPSYILSYAGISILICTIFDVLDGFSARKLKSFSNFGKQLDSLSDLVCFGIAPAVLFYTLTLVIVEKVPHTGIIYKVNSFVSSYLHEHVLSLKLLAFLFPICAVIRLSRFNIKKEEIGITKNTFEGLPSTFAGGFMGGILVFKFIPSDIISFLPWFKSLDFSSFSLAFLSNIDSFLNYYTVILLVYILTAALMISKFSFLKYSVILNYFAKKGNATFLLFLAFFIFGLLFYFKYFLFVAGSCYIIFTLIMNVFFYSSKKSS